MCGFIKKLFIGFLTSVLVNASSHTKCVSLSNQKCKIQPTLINLHPNKYSQEIHYYLFGVKLDKCVESCNTLNDLSNKVCVPNKAEDLNLSVFNMITGINELETLTKQISCKCKCKFDGRKCNSNQKWNNNKCWCECRKYHICGKDYIWNLATCSCKNGKYLLSIIDDSMIKCDEIIEETKTTPTNFNEKNSFCILLTLLLINIALLIAVSIYFCLIKYKAKQNIYCDNTSQMTNY